jgi:hypothetical protein
MMVVVLDFRWRVVGHGITLVWLREESKKRLQLKRQDDQYTSQDDSFNTLRQLGVSFGTPERVPAINRVEV